jgi:hypothetical protein
MANAITAARRSGGTVFFTQSGKRYAVYCRNGKLTITEVR